MAQENGDLTVERNLLASAFNSTNVAQVVKMASRKTQITLLCRVIGDEEKWLQLVREILLAEAEADRKWAIFIAQHYFLDREGGLRFGWHISLTSRNLHWASAKVKKVIDRAAVKLKIAFRVEEMRLPHVGVNDRNVPKTPGGAGAVGSSDAFVPAILRKGS